MAGAINCGLQEFQWERKSRNMPPMRMT